MFWLPLNFEMPAPDEVDCQEGKVIEAYKKKKDKQGLLRPIPDCSG